MNTMDEKKIFENAEMRALLEHAGCGICAYRVEPGKKTQMLYMTTGFCEICEASREEIFQAYKEDRFFGINRQYHEDVDRAIASAIATGKDQEVTYLTTPLGGNLKWCTLKLSPDRRDDHIILFATFLDVTKQVKPQKELTDLIQNVPGAVCLYHFREKRLEPVLISNRYSEMLGTDAYEVLNHMEDMNFKHVHPEDLERIQQKVMEALVKTHHLDETYRSYHDKLKRYIWINVQGTVIPQEDGSSYSYVLYTDITRDKEIEQKLRANEQILEAATTNAGVWYWNCHWRQNVAYMSEKFQRDFGVPPQLSDFCDTIFQYHVVDESYHEDFVELCRQIQKGAQEAEVVVKGYMSDGTAHWMRFKLSNIFDENGVAQEAVGIMSLVDDVVEMRRKYEIEKQHVTEGNDLIANCCMNISSWSLLDYSGNQGQEQKEEYHTIEQVSEKLAAEAIDSDIRKQLQKMHEREYLLQAFTDGNLEAFLEYQRVLPNGTCIWARSEFHLMLDQNGTDLLLFEYCYNINMKKTVDILMHFAVNDDYDLMGFANTQDGQAVMVYGKNSYNPCHQEILEDDYQRSLYDFATHAVLEQDRQRYLELADLSCVAGYLEQHDNLEFYFTVLMDGELRSKKVRYLKYEQNPNSIIFIQSDITQLIEEQNKSKEVLEAALEKARVASIAKTSFLSQMSHEIRTPMNAIIGMTKLAKQTEEHQEIKEYLEKIDSSSQYLLGILNDILDMSRIESGKLELHPQWIDGCRVVLDCVEMLKPAMDKKNLTFRYPDMMKNSRLRFYLDPLRIQQIYMNLLNNAVKFTPDGGTIELSIQNISHEGSHGTDRITIRDTGCGMSQEFLTRIFHPFEMEENVFSSRVQGTGLGLALVKSYINKMGGKIWVESELGKGSTFTFDLPYEAKLVNEEKMETEGVSRTNLEGKRVLLVDDHPLNREIAKKLLVHEKVEVVTAVDGGDACDTFRNAEDDYFDAILMDIRMPKMNGLEATRAIRTMDKQGAKTIPIIAMTANAFDEDMEKSLEAGMNAHLAKPIEPDKLFETLGKYVK